jgi:hypothetical protein
MIFSLDVRRARKGDCLLLHYGTKTKPRLMLIDGGPSDVYKPHLEPRIQEIRKKRKLADVDSLTVDHMMVSHVDDDHIRGLIDLTGEEIVRQDAHEPLLLNVLNLWHNSFDAVINHTPDELTASLTKQFGAAATKGAGLDDAKVTAVEDKSKEGPEVVRGTLQVLASIEQGFRLRGNAKKLGYGSNSEFGGALVMAYQKQWGYRPRWIAQGHSPWPHAAGAQEAAREAPGVAQGDEEEGDSGRVGAGRICRSLSAEPVQHRCAGGG